MQGRRKRARPIAIKRSMHVVLRAGNAKGPWNMLHKRHKNLVKFLVVDTAKRYEVRLYGWENVGNHLHLHVRVKSRRSLQYFLRVLPERIAYAITGCRSGRPIGRFWTDLAFSRIVAWGREFFHMRRYLWINHLEALGVPRKKIQHYAPFS